LESKISFDQGPLKVWTGIIKFGLVDHLAKFYADRSMHLGDLALNKNIVTKHKQPRNLGKAQHESARRPKSDWGKISGEGVIFPR